MKKYVLFFSVLFLPILVKAAWIESFNMAQSSYTITSEGPVYISSSFPGTVFLGVNVASTSTAGTLKIYDSVGAATNQIANISLASVGCYRYEILISSGLVYTTTNNASGVTILYKKTRP